MKKVHIYSIFILLVVFPLECLGQITPSSGQPTTFEVMVGKSLTLESKTMIKRASVASPEIADLIVVSPVQVYVTGKTPGTTNLTFWGTNDKVFSIVSIEVIPDLKTLKELIGKLFPEEKNLKIDTVQNNISLSGSVTSATNLSEILTLAKAAGKVVNLTDVSGVQQVMIEVRVAEVSHSLLRRMGVNWSYFTSGGKIGVGLLGGLTSIGGLPSSPGGQSASSAVNLIFGALKGGTTWAVFIDLLKEAGLVKVLASPTLITLSGKPANFLAGGEIPIPVPQASGMGTNAITIDYKPFGVGLNFHPTVLSSKKINMTVAPEVSEPDFTNSLTLSGFTVPSFTTRRVSTTIELDDGQSFVIAGLLRDDARKLKSQYPILGDIPILGALFRSTTWVRNESELIVIATAHLVKPTDFKQPLPTDKYSDPNDFEFYLNGRSEGQGSEPTKVIKGGKE